jgi:hypothetical protein
VAEKRRKSGAHTHKESGGQPGKARKMAQAAADGCNPQSLQPQPHLISFRDEGHLGKLELKVSWRRQLIKHFVLKQSFPNIYSIHKVRCNLNVLLKKIVKKRLKKRSCENKLQLHIK